MTHFVVWSSDDPTYRSGVFRNKADALATAEQQADSNPRKSYFVAQLLSMSTTRGVETIDLPAPNEAPK